MYYDVKSNSDLMHELILTYVRYITCKNPAWNRENISDNNPEYSFSSLSFVPFESADMSEAVRDSKHRSNQSVYDDRLIKGEFRTKDHF